MWLKLHPCSFSSKIHVHVNTYLDWATPVLISTPWSWPPLSRDTPCSLVSSMFMNNVHLLETDLRCLLDCSQCTTSTKCPSLSLAVSNQRKIDTWLNWTVLFNISYLPPSLHQVQLGLSKSKSTKSNSESIFRSFSPHSMKSPQKPHFFCCLTWEFWEYQLA